MKVLKRNLTYRGRYIVGALAASCMCFASQANAQDSRWYVGGSIGQSYADYNREDYQWDGITNSQDERSTGYKATVGYLFNKHISLEAAYVNLGKFNWRYHDSAVGGNAQDETKVSGFNFSVVGKLPVTDSFSFLGKVGAFRSKTKDNFTQDAAFAVHGSARGLVSETKTNFSYGVGAEYALTKSIAIRAEYENFGEGGSASPDGNGTGRSTTSLFSVGAIYSF